MINVKEYDLGENVEFLSYNTEEEWHALRKDGIGGSDTGAIMGLNKYTSPLKLYRIKKGIYAEDTEDNVYIKKGKDLESVIFEKYVKPDPDLKYFNIIHPEHVFVNKQFPWLRANCDGLAVNTLERRNNSLLGQSHIVIEIKWVSEWAEANWDGEDYYGIPASYYAQVQHYMTVTGAGAAFLYAMFDRTWTVKRYIIPYNKSFAIKMLAETKEFYSNLLIDREPKVTATLDKGFMVDELLKMPASTEESEELTTEISEYLAIKEQVKQLEKEMDKHFNMAVAMYLEGKRPTGAFKMSIASCKTPSFDSKRFAADHPDVYEQYKNVTEYTRTTMKKK